MVSKHSGLLLVMDAFVCLSHLASVLTVYFHSADTNNDRFLDPIELEALFFKEVKDIYGDDRDQTEIREEMARMREHVLEEVSTVGACVFDHTHVQKSDERSEYAVRIHTYIQRDLGSLGEQRPKPPR